MIGVRSSFCIQGDCVEVFWAGRAVNVRNSKLGPASPIQRWSPEQWEELLAAVYAGNSHPGVGMVHDGGVAVGLRLAYAGHERLTFDLAEWQAFVQGVWVGEFALGALQAAASSSVPQDSPAGRLSDQPSSGGAVRVDQPGADGFGDVVLRTMPDGSHLVVEAPSRSRVALEVLVGPDPLLVVERDLVYVGQDVSGADVVYRVTGWDPSHYALEVQRAFVEGPHAHDAWARAVAPLVEHASTDHPGTGEEEAVGAVSSGGEVGPVFAAGSTDPVDECDGADRPAERAGAVR